MRLLRYSLRKAKIRLTWRIDVYFLCYQTTLAFSQSQKSSPWLHYLSSLPFQFGKIQFFAQNLSFHTTATPLSVANALFRIQK